MDEWMDGWMEELMNVRMDDWKDKWINMEDGAAIDGEKCGFKARRAHWWIYEWMDELIWVKVCLNE